MEALKKGENGTRGAGKGRHQVCHAGSTQVAFLEDKQQQRTGRCALSMQACEMGGQWAHHHVTSLQRGPSCSLCQARPSLPPGTDSERGSPSLRIILLSQILKTRALPHDAELLPDTVAPQGAWASGGVRRGDVNHLGDVIYSGCDILAPQSLPELALHTVKERGVMVITNGISN